MTKHNIEPVYNQDSRILILGSFPSVKSREAKFFYHHPQNRFWKVLAALFQEEVPQTIEEKKTFLLRNHLALWDVIESCDIKGSSDSSITNVKVNDLDLIVYPTTKNKVFTLSSGSSASAPGSFLGSVIGYPSITVPMGYINEFPYGLEFFSLKNEENLLYSVADIFEEVNNLGLTNSPLAPSLYEIPDYIETLMTYYEAEENELTTKAKEYFLNYSNKSEEENEIEANILIQEYQKLETKQNDLEKENDVLKVFIMILFTFIFLSTILFVLIYRMIMKKIKGIYKKIKKQDRQNKKILLK